MISVLSRKALSRPLLYKAMFFNEEMYLINFVNATKAITRPFRFKHGKAVRDAIYGKQMDN